MHHTYKDMRIAVTGAAGTVGRELVSHLLRLPVREVRALDNNESELFYLAEAHRGEQRFQAFLADVRDYQKMWRMLDSVDLVFHGAAFKHVPLCEKSPFDAVQTNIVGVQNLIQASLANKVRKVLFMSSDKAVNPTNVMGTTKLMGERLMTAANAFKRTTRTANGTIFSSTRFGNVAGSRGSVVNVFLSQIAKGGPVTLTDPEMSRFIMRIDTAVKLVIRSMHLAKGGEVFITKMPVLRIQDLAHAMIDLAAPQFMRRPGDIPVVVVGSRPGEKLYEELMNSEEPRRAFDTGDFFIILPAFRNIYEDIDYTYKGLALKPAMGSYNSAGITPMTRLRIREFLLHPDLLPSLLKNEFMVANLTDAGDASPQTKDHDLPTDSDRRSATGTAHMPALPVAYGSPVS